MKREVLVMEYQELFCEKIACRILFQDEEILKRGKFVDKEIGVESDNADGLGLTCDVLFIRGTKEEYDDKVIILTRDERNIVRDRVEKINEKYGVEQWRATKGQEYYCVNTLGMVALKYDSESFNDDKNYNLGNYFKTWKQANEYLKRIRKMTNDYQKELLEEEND